MIVGKKNIEIGEFLDFYFYFYFFRNRKRNWIGFREEIGDDYGKGLGLFGSKERKGKLVFEGVFLGEKKCKYLMS
jgi:hypothetical protein